MRNRVVALCCLIASELAVGGSTLAGDFSDFIDFSLRSGTATLLPGRLYVPPEATTDPRMPRPFIIFLHGGGDAGDDNTRQLNQNIEGLFAEAKRRGAFLYAPQAPLNWRPRVITDRVMTMITGALADYNIDPARLYLTGYSSGGGGVWNILSRYPGEFAAAMPVAPVSPEPDFQPANLVGQSVVAIHARNDAVASVHTTRNVVNRILTAARRPLPAYPRATDPDFTFEAHDLDLYYLEPAAGGHSVHFPVYRLPDLYQWMFSHGAAVPEPYPAAAIAPIIVALVSRRYRRCRSHLQW